MADSSIISEREQRKLYLRARQRVILGSIITFLIVALVVALFGAFGNFGSKNAVVSATAENNYNVVTACVARGAATASTSEVKVRVLNGTNKSGLGTAVAEELRNRGFSLQNVGDYEGSSVMERTEIRYGKKSIRHAYSIAAHFNDAILRMDDRSNTVVDVIIGSSFNDLVSTKKTPKPGTKLKNFSNCVDASKLKNLPQSKKK